ncbi:MAG: Mg2+ and Co2+ transporter CorB [Clostridiaceae bacterium]|jgi:hypothetical protein|nr:Mg2+ and Co2+ transporter CorB [Clostridiaceae bacterium]
MDDLEKTTEEQPILNDDGFEAAEAPVAVVTSAKKTEPRTDATEKRAENARAEAKKASRPRVKPLKKKEHWALKITLISFPLTIFVTFLSDLVGSGSIVVIALLLLFLVLANVLFDGIGVAVTACDPAPLASMAARKIHGAKIALKLVKNAEKVSNICSDVIGDIFGIVSGTCSLLIVLKILRFTSETYQQLLTIMISGVVGALTIGGKAYMKNVAISNSRNFVLFIARILAVFNREERKNKNDAKRNKNAR